LSVGFEICEDKSEKSVPKFISSSTYHKEEETIKSTKTHYPSNPKSSFNPKKYMKKETPKSREEVFVYMFCGHAGHLDEFCFRRKTIEKRHLDYARNSYRDELINFCLVLILVFRLDLILVFCLALTLMICLISLMDLIIAHMILVHKRTTLCLDAFVVTHVIIMMIVSRVGLVFLQEGFTLVLS
jgi:hypothetical protein